MDASTLAIAAALGRKICFATFSIDPATGNLIMSTPHGYAGPSFVINNDNLEVVVNA